MVLLEVKTADQGKEKHVPVIEKQDGGYLVKVGDVPHPMIEKHWITFIELRTKDAVYRKYLHAEQEPQAFFATEEAIVEVVSYCNIHGLWVA
jgi:superoxide reductase